MKVSENLFLTCFLHPIKTPFCVNATEVADYLAIIQVHRSDLKTAVKHKKESQAIGVKSADINEPLHTRRPARVAERG